LNKDGYDDIAIGAPYEGNGVIYIYQGSDHGIIVEPSQVSSVVSIRLLTYLNYIIQFERICSLPTCIYIFR